MSNKLTKEEKLAMAMKMAAPNIKPTSASAGMERALLAEQRRMNECGEDVYKKFLNRDVWTIDESACLICELDPYKNLKESPYGGFYFCEFNNKFKETVDLINASIETGKLKYFKNLTNPYKFEPQTVIEWALKKNLDIPKALSEWYEKQPKLVETMNQTNKAACNQTSKTLDDDLNEKSKRFYLGIIAALLSKPRDKALDIHSTSAVSIFEGLVKGAGYSISNTKARDIINGLKDIETDKK